MSEKLQINLGQFKSEDGILIGRLNGMHARMILRLDELDKLVKKDRNIEVELFIPNDILKISDSFLIALIQETLNTLDNDTFTSRISFKSDNEEVKKYLDGFLKFLKDKNTAYKILKGYKQK
jgi:Cdc6-like AAA superfamily ATPase